MVSEQNFIIEDLNTLNRIFKARVITLGLSLIVSLGMAIIVAAFVCSSIERRGNQKENQQCTSSLGSES